MNKINFPRVKKSLSSSPNNDSKSSVLILLSVCFILGIIAGSFYSMFISADEISSQVAGYIETSDNELGFFRIFWNLSKFHFCVIFLAGSIFGVVIIPVIVFLRAYFISCTAAAIIAVYHSTGWILSVAILGLPSLIAIPCLFVLSTGAFSASGKLLTLSMGDYRPWSETKIFRNSFICVIFLALSAMIEQFIVPAVVGLII